MKVKKAFAFSMLALVAASLPTGALAALTSKINEAAASTVTKDGALGTNEYGTGNSQKFSGAGTGFGGVLGTDSVYMASDATNLYVAVDPAADLNDIVVVYLNTRAGGFVDADMDDDGDGGRSMTSNLGPFGNDTMPSSLSSAPDFALVVGNFGTVLFELNAGTTDNHLEFKAFDGTFTTNNPTIVREVVIPWATLETASSAPVAVEFFAAYGAQTFLSNESVPPSATLNAGGNPGNTATAAYDNHNKFVPAGVFDGFTGSGTYTVGPGGNYASLSSFVEDVTGIIHGEGGLTLVAASTAAVGVGTSFLSEVVPGDKLQVGTQIVTVASVESDTALTLSAGAAAASTAATYTINRATLPTITGNVTALITGNITEPKNLPIMGDFSVHTLTIKPATATTPRVTFTRALDNSGTSGHVMIGGSLTNGNVVSSTTDNVVIDGSNTVAGTTRDLTFYTAQNYAFIGLINVFGDNDNVIIKNTKIINDSPSTGGSITGIRYGTSNVALNTLGAPYQATAGFADPDSWIVDNCEVTVYGIAAGQGHGIRSSVSGSPTGAASQQNWQITNSDITAGIRGVFLDAGHGGSVITGNRIITPARAGFETYGIFNLNGRTPTTPSTATWSNNVINVGNSSTLAAVTGATGIRILSAGAIGNAFVIDNNTIVVDHSTSAFSAGVEPFFKGIECTSGVTVTVRHNSIRMIGGSMAPDAASANMGGLIGPSAANGNWTVRNNTISASTPFVALIRNARDVPGQPYSSNNNNLFASNGALTGTYGTTPANFTTLANWQAIATFAPDAASVAVDPSTFTGTDLHLISDPGAGFKTSNVIGGALVNDVDGQARSLTAVYYGADEFTTNTLPTAVVGLAVASIAENATGVVVTNAFGTDADLNDVPVITASATNGAVLSVSPQSADTYKVNLTAGLNYEAVTSFNVTLTATDRAGQQIVGTPQTIAVTNVNEVPTDIVTAPVAPALSESDSTGTLVATLSTVDPDAAETHVYSLVAGAGDTNNGLFSIVGNELRTNQALLNLTGPLSVRVQTQDQNGAGLTYAEAISISLRDDYATVVSATSAQTISVTSTSGTLTGLTAAVSPGSEPSGVVLPQGVVSFSVTGLAVGGSTTITIAYPNTVGVNRAYKVNGTTYTEIPGATISATSISYSITDGGALDQDSTANGTIVDPAGPAVFTTSVGDWTIMND